MIILITYIGYYSDHNVNKKIDKWTKCYTSNVYNFNICFTFCYSDKY